MLLVMLGEMPEQGEIVIYRKSWNVERSHCYGFWQSFARAKKKKRVYTSPILGEGDGVEI